MSNKRREKDLERKTKAHCLEDEKELRREKKTEPGSDDLSFSMDMR